MENNFLFIDDERFPKTQKNWHIVRNYGQAVSWMKENGCPSYVSFDHDLGEDLTGYSIALWMVDEDLSQERNFIPKDFAFNIHSANPVGAANITSLLNSYLSWRVR